MHSKKSTTSSRSSTKLRADRDDEAELRGHRKDRKKMVHGKDSGETIRVTVAFGIHGRCIVISDERNILGIPIPEKAFTALMGSLGDCSVRTGWNPERTC